MAKNWTKIYSRIVIGGLALILGFGIMIGGIALVGNAAPAPSNGTDYTAETPTPPSEIFEWDCGCKCGENAPANDSTSTWLLALLGMILLAILVVLIFRRNSPKQMVKRGKGEDDLQNMLLMSQTGQGGYSQPYAAAPQPAASQPRYSAPQPRESVTDQMLRSAQAKVASTGQRVGTPSASTSTAQSAPRTMTSPTAQSPAPRGPIQSAPTPGAGQTPPTYQQ